jgi:diacylglycerol kinase family enzyme
MSEFRLLLNQASGGHLRGLSSHEVRETVEAAFIAAGHSIQSSAVRPRHLTAALDEFIREAPDAILVGGGDGTVSTTAHRLGGTRIALGILPMGTFNLAARDLGVPLDIPAAAAFLATAPIHPIDVLSVSGYACLCTTILGFYPEFAGIFENRDHGGHRWKKLLKIALGMPRTFLKSRPLDLIWSSPTHHGRARTRFSAFVPGRYLDTAGLVPSRTDFSSGHMTAYLGRHQKPAAALRGIFDYVIGHIAADPQLEIFQTHRLELRAARRRSCTVMLDGEILQLRFPLVLEILRQHLRVLVDPAKLAPAA